MLVYKITFESNHFFFTFSPQSPGFGCQLPEPCFLIWSQQVKRGRLGLPLVCLPTFPFWHRQEVSNECYYVIQYGQPQIQVLNHFLFFRLRRVLHSPRKSVVSPYTLSCARRYRKLSVEYTCQNAKDWGLGTRARRKVTRSSGQTIKSNPIPVIQRMGSISYWLKHCQIALLCDVHQEEHTRGEVGYKSAGWEAVSHGRIGKSRNEVELKGGISRDNYGQTILNDVTVNVNFLRCAMRESTYEMKNNCWLFERIFKIQENGTFLFEISFFFLKILTFLYYRN